MANVNKPFGFALSRSQDGAYSGIVTTCHVTASNSSKLYIGDGVVLSTGSNSSNFMGFKAGSLPIIGKAAATGKVDGVIVGFIPNGDTYITGCLPAYTAAAVLVILNPMAKFNIQATGEATAAMVGKFANISVSTAGNDYTGISGMALDISSVATDDSLQLEIVGVADYLTNELGNYSVLEVKLNPKCGVQAKLTAGTGIDITDNTISVTG